MNNTPRINPWRATAFAALAVAIVFAIAASWEFLLSEIVMREVFGSSITETMAERWRSVLLATSWASIALAVLCPFALRVLLERNRALDEVERQASELQQALGRQNDRFSVALQNMRQGLAMFDAEQRLVDFNERFASLYYLSPESLWPGMPLQEIIDLHLANGVYAGESPEDYVAERLDWASKCERARKVLHLNSGRSIEVTRETLPDGGWLALHEDITERMEAENALKRQNHRFNAALDNMSQGLCMFDAQQRLIVSNNRYAEMYGLPQDLMQPGVTLREILEHRIANGIFGEESPEDYIAERMAWVTSGKRSSKVQILSDGRAIAIVHEPMGDGGWLTTHEDITERKKSSDLLRAVIDSFPGGIAAFDSDLNLRMINKNYYKILKLSEDECPIGAPFETIVRCLARQGHYGEGDTEKIVRDRVAWLERRQRHSNERHRPDGTVLDVEGFPLSDGGGYVSTCVDVTGRKRAEAMNLRLARIVEDSINEVYVFDAATLKFLQVNASACENLGYSMEELSELTPLDLKPQFSREEFEGHLAPLRSGEKNHIRFETVHRRKDGTCYDVEVLLQLIGSAEQPVFAAIIEDVTDRNKALQALRQSEEQFSKAFHTIPALGAISRPETGAHYDVNEAWIKTLGYSREEAMAYSALQLGIWADASDRKRFVEMLKKEGSVRRFEAKFRAKDGREIDGLVSGEYLDVGGEPRLLVVTEDITERKRAEARLIEHRDDLQQRVDQATAELKSKAETLERALAKEKELNELQRQFVSMASHEFRTPLAVIDGLVQRMIRTRGQITPEELEARAKRIRGAVNTMTNLMESTLSAARMDAGKIDVTIAHCNLRAVILDVCIRQLEIDANKNISCDLSDLPETIAGDTAALNQVFTNLLSNAVKYTPDRPDIRVKGWLDGPDVVVTVQDNGLGIDEDDLPKMFDRFFRAKTSTGIPGTGIGLSLVKTLIELHGGSIVVQSRKGEGSTFTVRLPVQGPSKKAKRSARAA